MLRAQIGDLLVGPGRTIAHGEVVGTIIRVHGPDGGPPFTVRRYDDGGLSKVTPDPERFWIRSQVDEREVGAALRGLRSA